jgi:YD repeat-containing protein
LSQRITPAYSGNSTNQFYYVSGSTLLDKEQIPGLGKYKVYEYDGMGQLYRSGIDINGDGDLNLSSSDRIEEAETKYYKSGSDWYRQTNVKVYPTTNSSTSVELSISRKSTLGLNSPTGPGTTVSIDADDNETTQTTDVVYSFDSSSGAVTNCVVTVLVDLPDSTTDTRQVFRNGVLQKARSEAGIEVEYVYDDLGRQTGQIHPRTGTNTVHFASNGQVDWTEDAAGNKTFRYYDSSSGRLNKITDSNGGDTYYDYTTRGELYRTWGDTPYPVEYSYDDWGRMSTMKTYRLGTYWDEATWNATGAGAGDLTTWLYQEATGLMTNKLDAASNGVSYTYDVAGRLSTRTWARQSGGSDLTTTYQYDNDTGELTSISYSDSTPDVSLTYTRGGVLNTVSDAVGTRTYSYDSGTLKPTSEAIVAGAGGLYSATITRAYEGLGDPVPGRYSGLAISGTDYAVAYDYDSEWMRLCPSRWC